ncbi:MAG: LpqB family beta-propeller domain-containing protein, partial [Microbacterium sp.]
TAEQDETDLAFELVEQDDGQWRISRAPAGIVLDRDHFPNVYSDFSLFFYDATWQRLVPDVRWFPEGTAETRIVNELLLGAGPYTDGGVKSAFPNGTRLATGGVAVGDDGSAEITLSDDVAGADSGVAARMTTQLAASLESVGVQSVRIRVGDDELSAEEFEPMSTKLDSRALVLADTGYDSGFGFLDAGGAIDDLDVAQAAVDALGERPTALSLSVDRQTVIAQTTSGDVWRQTGDGGDRLDQRDGLIEPTLDPQGFPWSVVGESPDELTSYTPDFQPIEIENAFAGAKRIFAMSASPDGSRMAASVSTRSGNWVIVVPIIRESDGTPTALGDPVGLTRLDGRGTDVAWLDSATVGVIARDSAGQQVVYQQIGGPSTKMASETGVVAIEAGSQQSLGRILDEDGTLYVRRGSAWQEAATGVQVLATQLGAPAG